MERERIIQILDYFKRYTDDKKSVTLKEIQSYFADQTNLGTISIASIRRDIDSLILAGHQIEMVRGAHNTYYYHLSNRPFSFNEIRFLVDSVSRNQFLTPQQKQKLFRKFEGLCSQAEVRQLMGRISVGTSAPPSLDLLDNLERIYQLIGTRRKIRFSYGKYDLQKKIVYTPNHRELLPCQVQYLNDRFYLRCYCIETGQPRTYRVDRMKDITAGAVTTVQPELPTYDCAVVDVYQPEEIVMLKLKVKRVLLDDMLEQFGSYATIRMDLSDENYVCLRAKVGVSYGFYCWLMKYGSNIEVLEPESVRRNYLERLKEAMGLYE